MPVIILIFNKCFSHSSIPSMWSMNFLISIFKKGDNYDPNNYRGIAIGSCLCKLFSLVLLERIEKKIASTQPISPNQIGFKAGHRTADHIFVINTLVNKIVRVEKKRLFIAFIDFHKAYDSVNRNLLLIKLLRLGISGLFYRNIKASLNSISYLVKVKGGHLNPISSSVGLKQGGVLRPLLFNVFIDDIGKIFDESCDPIYALKRPLSHLLYADDLALISSSQCGLNNSLSKLKMFCEKWQIKVNLKKSQIVIFNPAGKKLNNYIFKLGNVNMEIVKSYTYLGIELLASGSFWLTKENLMDKARKAMFPLFSTISQFQLPCANSVKLFQALIRPIALYNAENWAIFTFGQIKKIEENPLSFLSYLTDSDPDKVFQKYIKFILGVNSSCTNIATLGEIGEYPMMVHAMVSLLTFWHRICNMPEATLVKQAMEIQSVLGPENSEWLGTVKLLLSILGLNSHYLDTKLLDTASFNDLVRKRIKTRFINLWQSHVSGVNLGPNESSKLRFYKLFKNSFEREPYLDLIPTFQMRKYITKFRCSDHVLEIETGRHKNIKVEERVCKICHRGIEDELHFLTYCNKYNDLRAYYFGNENYNWRQIIQCREKYISFKLGNFLTKAFKTRNNHLKTCVIGHI